MKIGTLTAYAEVFHGCKESADYFINQVEKVSEKGNVWVILENLSIIDGLIINYLFKTKKYPKIKNLNKYLVTKRGLMKSYILPKIYHFKNINILGIEADNPVSKIDKKILKILEEIGLSKVKINELLSLQQSNDYDRYDFMEKQIKNGLQMGYNMVYFGFHLDYGPRKNGHILSKIKLKYGNKINTYAMCSPNIKAIVIDLSNTMAPKSIEEAYIMESKYFNEHGGEKKLVKRIEAYIPATKYEKYLEEKYRRKITKIFTNELNKMKKFRQFGIWIAVYKNGYGKQSPYNQLKNYDGIIYLPEANYLE